MLYEILHEKTGRVLFRLECGSFVNCVETAVKSRADLSNANLPNANLPNANLPNANLFCASLFRANLRGASLRGADLSNANLSRADLSNANLSNADLSNANLFCASLFCANLRGADLSGANLSNADLSNANLSNANLSRADLSGANLSNADLFRANLSNADLFRANLYGAQIDALVIARQKIVPDGTLVVWKKLSEGVVAQLEIPNDAQRTNAIGSRKCRSSAAVVVALFKDGVLFDGEAFDRHAGKTRYKAGEVVLPDSYDDSALIECSNGIHWFLTREEAEAY